MKTRLIHFLLAICLTSTALARIGETEVEIIKRYGTPKVVDFVKNGEHNLGFEVKNIGSS